jgi:curved DNA-binding protein CbpA
MSSSAPGKFQDHYSVLGIDPKANSSAIQTAYAKLAERYRPGNPHTSDREKFDAINLAFEVLSDAGLRAEFDKLKGVGQDEGKPQFSGPAFFDALKIATDLRAAMLCVLYDRRRKNPYRPSVSSRHLEGMLKVTKEEMDFALWYLKQRLLVMNDDKSSLQITVDGMDYLERNPPTAASVMPFVKQDAVQKADADVPGATKSVLMALNRALAKESPEASPSKVKIVGQPRP